MSDASAVHRAEERLQTILKAVVVGARAQDPASRPGGEDLTGGVHRGRRPRAALRPRGAVPPDGALELAAPERRRLRHQHRRLRPSLRAGHRLRRRRRRPARGRLHLPRARWPRGTGASCRRTPCSSPPTRRSPPASASCSSSPASSGRGWSRSSTSAASTTPSWTCAGAPARTSRSRATPTGRCCATAGARSPGWSTCRRYSVRLLPLDHEPVEVEDRIRISPVTFEHGFGPASAAPLRADPGSRAVFFKSLRRPARRLAQDRARVRRRRGAAARPTRTTGPPPSCSTSPSTRRARPTACRAGWGRCSPVLGSRQMEEVNFLYFENKSVPPLALLVSGGRLSEASVPRIERFIEENLKGKNNFHKMLILEAEGGSGAGDNARAKIELRAADRRPAAGRALSGLRRAQHRQGGQRVPAAAAAARREQGLQPRHRRVGAALRRGPGLPARARRVRLPDEPPAPRRHGHPLLALPLADAGDPRPRAHDRHGREARAGRRAHPRGGARSSPATSSTASSARSATTGPSGPSP